MAERGSELWGHSFEPQLAVVLEKLLRGELSLHQVSPSVAGLFTLGYDLGRESLQNDLRNANDAAAVWYERANNPGQKYPDMIQRRIEIAADEARYSDPEVEIYTQLLIAASTPGLPGRAA